MDVRAFRIPDARYEEAKKHLPSLVHRIDGVLVVSAAGAKHLESRVRWARALEPHRLDPERWEATAGRLNALWAAMVSEPLPEAVAHEVRFILYADPELHVELMGAQDHVRSTRIVVVSTRSRALDPRAALR